MSAPVIYPLKHPLTTRFRGPEGDREETVTELTLRRLRGGDLRAGATIANDELKGLFYIGKIAGLETHQVDGLDAADIAELGGILDGFLSDGPKTGPTSSET